MAGDAKLRGGDLKVGDEREQVVVENLGRTQVVQYAGASPETSTRSTRTRASRPGRRATPRSSRTAC
jgi:hypothetical protein